MSKPKVEIPIAPELDNAAHSSLEEALKDTKHISPKFIDTAYREGAAFGYSVALREMNDRLVLSFYESSKLADLLHALRPALVHMDSLTIGDLQVISNSVEILTRALKVKPTTPKSKERVGPSMTREEADTLLRFYQEIFAKARQPSRDFSDSVEERITYYTKLLANWKD